MLKISFNVGPNSFTIEGDDFDINEHLIEIIGTWTRALGPIPDQDDIDAIEQQLNSQQNKLQDAVNAAQGAIPQEEN